MKNSSFDSSFNSVQSINTNLSYLKKEYNLINNHIILAIVRASRSIRISRDHLRFIRILKFLNLTCYSKAAAASQEELINTGVDAVLANKELSIAQLASLKKFKLIIKLFSKNYTASNLNFSNSNLSLPKAGQYKKILNSNLLLRNRKFDLLRSNLAVILTKRIKTFSEIFSAAAILQQHTHTENNCKNLPYKNYIISQYLQNYMQTKLSLNKYKGCSSKAAARINYNKIIGYKFKNNYNNKFKKNHDSSNLVTSCSAAKIRFLSNKIYIRLRVRKAISRLKNKINLNLLFKLRKLSLNKVFHNKFKLICEILSNSFNRPVELQLTRLHHPYHDSNILVNILTL